MPMDDFFGTLSTQNQIPHRWLKRCSIVKGPVRGTQDDLRLDDVVADHYSDFAEFSGNTLG